jgi:hypothetical protein
MTFLTGALFGASIALVLVMILRRPPGITKNARKDDAPLRRKWRDLPTPKDQPPHWERDGRYRCIDCETITSRDDLSWDLCVPCRDKAAKESLERRVATIVTVPTWDKQEVGGIDYRFMGVGNEEV